MIYYVNIPDYIYSVDNVVYMRVTTHFRSINNIDTVNQTFGAKIWIQLRWMIEKRFKSVNLEEEWYPMLECLNNRGKLVHEQCVLMKKQKNERVTSVYANYLIQGTFSEQFNLKQFPIDMQQLHVNFTMWGFPMMSNAMKTQVDTTRFSPKKLKVYTRPHKNIIFKGEFIPCEVWNISSDILCWQGNNKLHNDQRHVTYCNLEVSLFISRKTVFYFINIVVPSFIIVASSISSRMLSSLDSQQSLVYTLMLTIVSLKFATVSFIPKTSIVTYLDMYSIGSFIWVTIAALHNVVMHQLYNFHSYSISTVRTADLAVIYWQLGSWVTIHIGIVLLLCEKFRKHVTYHRHHVINPQRSLVLTERHDRLKHIKTAAELPYTMSSMNGDHRDSSSDDVSIVRPVGGQKEKENDDEEDEEFSHISFPHPARTSTLSCINGHIFERNEVSRLNRRITQYLTSFTRQGVHDFIHEVNEE